MWVEEAVFGGLSTVAGYLVKDPLSRLPVVMVRWAVLVVALLRWRMGL